MICEDVLRKSVMIIYPSLAQNFELCREALYQHKKSVGYCDVSKCLAFIPIKYISSSENLYSLKDNIFFCAKQLFHLAYDSLSYLYIQILLLSYEISC